MMMEFQHFLLLVISLISILFLCVNKLIMRKMSQIPNSNFAAEKTRLPPGRSGWLLVGETLDFFFKAKEGCVHKFVTDRKNKYSSKIFRTSLMGFPMAILCDAEGNKFLFSNDNKFVKHWWPIQIDKIFPKSNNKPNTEHVKSIRKLLAFVLKGDVLREYVGEIDAVMKQHFQTDWNLGQVNVSDIARKYVSKLACTTFLGIEDQGKTNELQKSMEEITAGIHTVVPLDIPGSALHRAIKASKLLRKEFKEMIRQRKIDILENRAFPKKDLILQILLATDDDGQFFSEADIASFLLGMVQGAYGTVHHSITNIMMYLAEHPDVYNSVLREQKEIADLKKLTDRLSWEDLRKMKYSWNVACEVLRLKAPGLGGFKEAITDIKYGGFTIPKGWKIHWNAHATHMNPEYFPNPEKFDPTRFQGDGPSPYTFVPFGGGAHMCPGNEYARVTILIFLHRVVTKFRWEKLVPEEKTLHYPIPSPAQGLPVLLYPHKD